jgi:hypothetical protein
MRVARQGLPEYSRTWTAAGGKRIRPPGRLYDQQASATGSLRQEHPVHDVRFALRMLGKHPGFTAAVVLSLALGIGANTAIFTLIDAVMWRLLPIKDPEALLVVALQSSDGDIGTGFTYDQYTLLRENPGFR